MADDPINIVVTDGVDPNVANKLNAIADASDKGTKNLDALRASLAAIRGDNLTTLREQANTVTQSIKAELDATNALSSANTNAKSATASLASELSNSRTKIDAETAALKANTDAKKANADAGKVLDAQTGRMFSTHPINIVEPNSGPKAALNEAGALAGAQSAADLASIEAAAARATTATRQTESVIEDLGTKSPGFFAKLKTAALGGFDAIRDFASGNGSRFRSEAEALAGGAATAGRELENLTGHARGNSTAIRELLVIAREGGRGDFNRMAGSVSILAGALGLLPIAIGAAIVGFTAMAAARSSLNTEAEQQHLKDYAESLGLSEKEMRKLSDTTVDANGKMHEHNMLQVTYGDVFNGTVTTIKEGIADIAKSYGITTESTKTFTTNAVAFLKQFFAYLVGGVSAFINFLYTEAYNLVTAAQNVGTAVGNAIGVVFKSLVEGVIVIINGASSAFNAVSSAVGGPTIGMIKDVNVQANELLTGFKAFRGQDFFADVRNGANATNRALDATGKNILKAADARVKAEADAIKANRNPAKPKKEADPKTKDDYLDDENLKLDNQLKLFGMLKDAREVQSQLDAIQLEFQKRRMPLNDAELAQFRAKLVLIQQNNKVQAEMDKIYQDVNGPQQALNVGTAALNELLKRGNITLTEYNQQLDKLKRTFAETTDPLFKINEEIKQQATALDLAGDALDHFNNSEKVRQAFLAKGIDLTKNATAAQLAEAKAAVAALDANDKKKYVNNTVNQITDPMIADRKYLASKKDFFARIAEMEQKGVITHNDAERAKAAIDAKYNEIKLAGAETFFNTLAGLSASKNQVLATIGKAAAIADATIKGYQAVQNALASVPPPFNIAAAAATAAVTGVQIANIISTPTNVGSYWTGGDFIVRGKTGVDANRISMAVSDGERVTIQTQAQQQAAANNNEKSGGNGDTHVHNYFDEASFVAAMDSHAGEKVVMNIIARRKNQVKGTLK